LGALEYSYFYIRLYSSTWPQDGMAAPDVGRFSLAYGWLVLSVPALMFANRCFRRQNSQGIQWSMSATVILAVAFLISSPLALFDYGASPQDNAYGSLFCLLSVVVWILAVVGLALLASAQIRFWKEHWDREGSMALQMQVVSMYWYFVVVAAAIIYATLIWTS